MRRRQRSAYAHILAGFLLALLGIGLPSRFFLSAYAQPVPADGVLAKKLIEEGIQAYQNGNYDEAIAKLNQAKSLPILPRSSIALYLGLAYLQQDKVGDAVNAWKEYLEINPTAGEDPQGALKDLKDNKIPQYLTLLVREENHRTARALVAKELERGPGDPKTVAITYYRNLGSTNFGPLQKGLTALLISDIAQVKELSVVERDLLQAIIDEMQLKDATTITEKNAPQAGRMLGAGKVATGSFLDISEQNVRLDSVVAETTTGQVLGAQNASGQMPQFHELEKTLALAILKDLGYDEQRLREAGLWEKITLPQTVSLAAFSAFSAGLEAKDRGDYAAARTNFEKALQEDPNFQEARKELKALPLILMTTGGIVTAISVSAPTATAATAGLGPVAATAGTIAGVSATTAAVVGAGAIAAGVGAGVGAAGGGSNGPECGNGKREGTEKCDKDDLGGTTCESLGFAPGGNPTCIPKGSPQQCTFDTSPCNPCGNGKKEGTEDCDKTDLGGATCQSLGFAPGGNLACKPQGSPQQCTFDTSQCSSCGNGVVDTDKGERCDPTATPSGCAPDQLCNATGQGACVTCCGWEVVIESCVAEPVTAGVIDVSITATIKNACAVSLTVTQTILSTLGDGQCSADGPAGISAASGDTGLSLGPVRLECFPTSQAVTLEVRTDRGTKTAEFTCL